jgi:hypothetical protein
MKRSCPFNGPVPKRVHVETRKRKLDFHHPDAKRHCCHVNLKRKLEFDEEQCKRQRADEMQSLHNLLTEAYVKIDQLQAELRQLKMLQAYYTERMNLPYNHDVTCY